MLFYHLHDGTESDKFTPVSFGMRCLQSRSAFFEIAIKQFPVFAKILHGVGKTVFIFRFEQPEHVAFDEKPRR